MAKKSRWNPFNWRLLKRNSAPPSANEPDYESTSTSKDVERIRKTGRFSIYDPSQMELRAERMNQTLETEWQGFNSVDVFFLKKCAKLPFITEMPLDAFYSVHHNPSQGPIMYACEKIDTKSLWWRGMQRRFCYYIFDSSGTLLCTFERRRMKMCSSGGRDGGPPPPEAVVADWGLWKAQDLSLTKCHGPFGEFMGQFRDDSSCCSANHSIEDLQGRLLFLRLPTCAAVLPMFRFRRCRFALLDSQGFAVGFISDRMKDDVKAFGAQFPISLKPVMKIMILGAVLDVNVTYFKLRLSGDCFFCFFLLVWVFLLLSGLVVLELWVFKQITF